MKRTFYFLRDSATGQFYTGQGNCLMEFKDAAVYFQRRNAEKKMPEIIRAWEHEQKWLSEWKKQGNAQDQEFIRKTTKAVKTHENLPNWGVEIISGEVLLPER